MFLDAILAKRERISSDHFNFPIPARPENWFSWGVVEWGHLKWSGLVVCSDLVLVGFCVVIKHWCPRTSLDLIALIFFLHHFKFNPSSFWPVRSHALNWKRCWSSEWSVALLTVQIKACSILKWSFQSFALFSFCGLQEQMNAHEVDPKVVLSTYTTDRLFESLSEHTTKWREGMDGSFAMFYLLMFASPRRYLLDRESRWFSAGMRWRLWRWPSSCRIPTMQFVKPWCKLWALPKWKLL